MEAWTCCLGNIPVWSVDVDIITWSDDTCGCFPYSIQCLLPMTIWYHNFYNVAQYQYMNKIMCIYIYFVLLCLSFHMYIWHLSIFLLQWALNMWTRDIRNNLLQETTLKFTFCCGLLITLPRIVHSPSGFFTKLNCVFCELLIALASDRWAKFIVFF